MADDEEPANDCPFAVHVAVADTFWGKKLFKKALASYTKALEMEAEDKLCLVKRARCHISMGSPKLALADAEAVLKEDKTFVKALYQKAEALYTMGDFEFALVFYHRGNKIRPELGEFKLGIQKATEAIENCVGTPETVELNTTGNLDFLKEDITKKSKAQKRQQAAIGIMAQKQALMTRQKTPVKKPKESPKTVKQLLGDLYADREYLEKLLEDKANFGTNEKLEAMTRDAVSFLDRQTEFWRQQKPIYARKNDYRKAHSKPSPQLTSTQLTQVYFQGLVDVQTTIDEGRTKEASHLANHWLHRVEGQTYHELPAKSSIIAQLHSCLGAALSQQGRYEEALVEYKKDLQIGRRENEEAAISRALDNIGRTLSDLGRYGEAIKFLKEKLPMATEADEKTWLNYSLGRAHLKLDRSDEALEYAETALEHASQGDDDVWLINVNVLLGHIHESKQQRREAAACYESALELSVKVGDTPSEEILRQQLAVVMENIGEESVAPTLPVDQEEENDDNEDELEGRGSPDM